MKRPLFTYPEFYYNPLTIRRKLSDKEVRAEYSRLRSVARKRITRLKEGGEEFKRYYQNWATSFPKLAELKNASDIRFALARVGRFLQGPTTVKEARADINRRLDLLKRSGFKSVGKDELEDFYLYMELMKEEFEGYQFDSEKIIEMYEIYHESMSPRQIVDMFRQWEDAKDKRFEALLIPRPNFLSAEDLRSGNVR